MRRSLLWLLTAGWLWLPLAFAAQTADPKQTEADEQKLQSAKVETGGPALLNFLKSRTLTEVDRERVDALIAQLGASSFKVREQASQELIGKGSAVLELLRQGLNHPDLEVQRRCEVCIQKIKERDHSPDVAAAVVRLVGARKPAGAVEVLLGYLPFADKDGVADDIRNVLAKLALRGGKVDKALADALTDKAAVRRAAAGEAVVLAGAANKHKKAIQALLRDPVVNVRWRVATALVMTKDKEAVPQLIAVLPEVSQVQAWQIEDILCWLAEGKSPPAVSLGTNEAGRKKCRDAWQAWWKENAAGVDLAVLQTVPRLLGRTTLVLLDINRVLEVEGDTVRWQIDDLDFPLDVQVLDNDRVLVAEYYGNRVTERDFNGKIRWYRDFPEPQMAQRLPNGNTFIASKVKLLEVDRSGNTVFSFNVPGGIGLPGGSDGIMKCAKAPTGEITCIYENGRVVRMDSTGRELSSFRVEIGKPLFGGRLAVLSGGRVLVPHHFENKVVEYDPSGKVIWQVRVSQPIAATRLHNGNTLVTSMNENRAIEFDRNGNEVWQYQRTESPPSRVTRAIRR